MLFLRREPRRCYWCGCVLTRKGTNKPRSATIDHLLPKSRGGGRGDNIVSCCYACNNRKGDMTAEEFMASFAER